MRTPAVYAHCEIAIWLWITTTSGKARCGAVAFHHPYVCFRNVASEYANCTKNESAPTFSALPALFLSGLCLALEIETAFHEFVHVSRRYHRPWYCGGYRGVNGRECADSPRATQRTCESHSMCVKRETYPTVTSVSDRFGRLRCFRGRELGSTGSSSVSSCRFEEEAALEKAAVKRSSGR